MVTTLLNFPTALFWSLWSYQGSTEWPGRNFRSGVSKLTTKHLLRSFCARVLQLYNSERDVAIQQDGRVHNTTSYVGKLCKYSICRQHCFSLCALIGQHSDQVDTWAIIYYNIIHKCDNTILQNYNHALILITECRHRTLSLDHIAIRLLSLYLILKQMQKKLPSDIYVCLIIIILQHHSQKHIVIFTE